MTSISEQLNEAVDFLRQGNKDQARAILKAVLETERTCGTAWYLLAFTAPSKSDAIACLEKSIAAAEIDGSQENLVSAVKAGKQLSKLKDTTSGQQIVSSAAPPRKTKSDTRPKPKKKTRLLPILITLLGVCVCGGLILAVATNGSDPITNLQYETLPTDIAEYMASVDLQLEEINSGVADIGYQLQRFEENTSLFYSGEFRGSLNTSVEQVKNAHTTLESMNVPVEAENVHLALTEATFNCSEFAGFISLAFEYDSPRFLERAVTEYYKCTEGLDAWETEKANFIDTMR